MPVQPLQPLLTWQCGVSDHLRIFVHIDIGAQQNIIEGKQWKAIVAGKVFHIEASCNCLCTEVADSFSNQMSEPKVRSLAQADHIGTHISQGISVVDILPAVNEVFYFY